MKFFKPTTDELSCLRADPLLWEQELDVRPDVAQEIERATGMRAGRVYWRSGHGHLYALELADLGRGRPSMAMVYGFWERYEPRPPEQEIDSDLLDLMVWIAGVTGSIEPSDVQRVAEHVRRQMELAKTSSTNGCREMRAKPEWLKPIFPWEQRAIIVNGRTMAYIDEGEKKGRPVLLLHGNPTWGVLYRDFVSPLTQAGYRAIVPDWIGAGYSDHPRVDAAFTLAHHIADLVSFIDQMRFQGFVIVGQDWGGPQGVGAALRRVDKLAALVLMNTWLFTGYVGRFHSSPRPWTTWHAPLIGQFFTKRYKVLSHGGPSVTSKRGMTGMEARAYHHVYDEPDSDHVVLTWPRTIPMRQGDRGWDDMLTIERRLPELANVPTVLLWAPEDNVFSIEYASRLKELLPHAEGPITFDRAAHYLQDDRGVDLAQTIVEFLNRTVGKGDGKS